MKVALPKQIVAWTNDALSLFYPNRCQLCGEGEAHPHEGYVCAQCWSRRGAIKFIVPPYCERCGLPFEGEITNVFECANCREMELHFESARAAVAAEGIVRDVIHRYKYDQALWFEPFLVDLLLRSARTMLVKEAWDLIVPVPLHRLKLREREFNQAERLALRLSEATGIRMDATLLKRVQPTRTQTQLSRKERAENVRRAFQFWGRVPVTDFRIVIVDDVLTTGATTSACAEVLRRNGAAKVCVWTVARGL